MCGNEREPYPTDRGGETLKQSGYSCKFAGAREAACEDNESGAEQYACHYGV